MCREWFKKIQWKKVCLAAFLYLLIAFVIRQIEAFSTMKYYLMPEYWGVWSKVMMPNEGPPPAIFHVLSAIFTFLTGLVFAYFYSVTQKLLGKSYWAKVWSFTVAFAVLSLVFSYLPMYLLINLPLVLLAVWFLTGVLTVFLGTLVFAKLIK